MNHFTLTAFLVSKDAIRFTPAGIPVMHCQLEHSGEVSEVGTARKIQMNVEAIAIGPIQKGLEQMDLGAKAVFEGFLAPKTLRNQRLVFHITHIQLKN
ncbi:primosomal replication protein N [Polynucleobacter arcticus]|uniref:Replication restart protein PriB n=1 Tax=Polynucleobacter arcticus TaxID=1743165 RepID=A0A6M9PLZ2_9BURK|nr:primosomal replication protein N [Polynucleobacter arcticus]QKM60952.1 primosomal replication protein N [Polynucleobacter arcticus]